MGPRLAAALAPLLFAPLLAACGEDEEPRVRVSDGGSDCKTQGTVETPSAPTIAAAVAPYLDPGQTQRIVTRVSDTATVHLEEKGGKVVAGVVNLVRTEDGWAVTTVERC